MYKRFPFEVLEKLQELDSPLKAKGFLFENGMVVGPIQTELTIWFKNLHLLYEQDM